MTVISAEAQEWVFLPVELVDQQCPVLGAKGDQRWLSNSEAEALTQEIVHLREVAATAEECELLDRAADLVDYAQQTRTGVAVVPTTKHP
ncbi:MAG TPA: hypothetical protein VE990_00500 [Acidimicrobiales bacterium]|nr:hypothetical protein [Acidimicrobiales bacterium]